MANKKQKITPCLWLDDQAKEAAEFYTSIFYHAEIKNVTHYSDAGQEIHGKEAGSVMTVEFEVEGYSFIALNGGPHFRPNPSISFFLNFDPSKNSKAAENLDRIWNKLSDEGTALMELGEYPFSPKYGWLQDKFGITWQLMLSNPEGEDRPFIVPSLMFSGENTNKAEEAVNFYTSVFGNSKIGNLAHYPENTGPAKKGSLMYGDFMIENTWMAAMDSGTELDFTFNEGISMFINCEDQDEIDYYWGKLSAVPEAEACGWLKDKYGISWQVVPENISELVNSPQAVNAIWQMKKIDIAKLEVARKNT
jgi:predicted 3-demethylubiquinone-9 3-methyltransferase (glyoxalase superfamily)